jgi:hypothetical protein
MGIIYLEPGGDPLVHLQILLGAVQSAVALGIGHLKSIINLRYNLSVNQCCGFGFIESGSGYGSRISRESGYGSMVLMIKNKKK